MAFNDSEMSIDITLTPDISVSAKLANQDGSGAISFEALSSELTLNIAKIWQGPKGDKGDVGPEGPQGLTVLPTPISLQASSSGQTVYALPKVIQNTSASWIEYCGVIYRAVSGDYTIANDVLTLSNPVIAPAMGDQFILVS